jgi:hypothetical protein
VSAYNYAAAVGLSVAKRASAPRPKVFCAAIVLLPCATLFLAIPIARTDWYISRTRDPYFTNMGYGLTLDHANCDVVIYGDSSALTGVDPQVIHDRTGLTACNISEYEGVFRTARLMVPDEYFRRNRPPRFLVFAFCPWNLAPYDDWEKSTTYEAILLRLRFLPNFETGVEMAEHPSQTFDFLTRTFRMSVAGRPHNDVMPEMLRYRQDHHGFMPMTGEQLTDCSTYPDRIHGPDPNWIDAMRRRYAEKGTHVIVDVTPVPACAQAFGYYAERLRGRTDNNLEQWPLGLFNGTAHLVRTGSRTFSERVARQIRVDSEVN